MGIVGSGNPHRVGVAGGGAQPAPKAPPSEVGPKPVSASPAAATRTLPVTLLVMTRDEEKNIARCLNSVPFVAEKVVVDSGSKDNTCAIAEECGARVVHQPWLGFGAQRNFATRQATYDWILFLDADEALSEELIGEFGDRLPEILRSSDAGIVLPRAAWYMGGPMRWYRPMVGEKLGRFYHRDRARWTDVRVHESLKFDESVQKFKHPVFHHHSPTLVHKQLKVLQYAELKAGEWIDKKRSRSRWGYPFVFLATFLKDYLLRLAFLDGWRGLIVAHVAANYAAYKRFRHYEMQRNPASRQAAAEVLDKRGLGF